MVDGPDLAGLMVERFGNPEVDRLPYSRALARERKPPTRRPPDDPDPQLEQTRGGLWLVDGDRMTWHGVI